MPQHSNHRGPEEEDKRKQHGKIFKEIIVENFPNKGKEIATQIQEAWRVHENRNQKKIRVAILISDKIDFKIKTITRDKQGQYIMIKGSNQEEEVTIINICTQHRSTSKCKADANNH